MPPILCDFWEWYLQQEGIEMNDRQHQLFIKINEFRTAFEWAEENGLKHVVQAIAWKIETEINKFMSIECMKKIGK